MFSKVLIANRGEIAVRIIRACREMGVRSVAVYSEADAAAQHAYLADESVCIGAAPSADSYLRGERIVEVALATGAEAVHPGYGFLAEREWFARTVRDAGLAFIGPSPEAIALLGSKTEARSLAQRAGVPIVPGNTSPLEGWEEASRIAEEIGYPVLLKAAAGGGGKGMRTVQEPGELPGAFDAARRESRGAFGDDALYIEKLIVNPRHVEVQVLADSHGNAVHLCERECSVQRRHQKMIEEAPSVAVNALLRSRIGETAVTLARAAGYTNAGTCEFLLDANGDYYFLEVNTRLQVEHPVTEMITGIDLVEWQLRIAAGEKLGFSQLDIAPRGWAIECRITSESPRDGFLPSTGRIELLTVPSGSGTRWDGGIDVGSDVTLHYDPLLGKLIVWSTDRTRAIARMRRALEELTIVGVDSSRDFHLSVMRDAEFSRGAIDVQWLERRLPDLLASGEKELARSAAIAAAMLSDADRRRGAGEASNSADTGASGARATRDGWPRPDWDATERPALG